MRVLRCGPAGELALKASQQFQSQAVKATSCSDCWPTTLVQLISGFAVSWSLPQAGSFATDHMHAAQGKQIVRWCFEVQTCCAASIPEEHVTKLVTSAQLSREKLKLDVVDPVVALQVGTSHHLQGRQWRRVS